jgi:hypothetical protein
MYIIATNLRVGLPHLGARSFINHYWLRSFDVYDFIRCSCAVVATLDALHRLDVSLVPATDALSTSACLSRRTSINLSIPPAQVGFSCEELGAVVDQHVHLQLQRHRHAHRQPRR